MILAEDVYVNVSPASLLLELLFSLVFWIVIVFMSYPAYVVFRGVDPATAGYATFSWLAIMTVALCWVVLIWLGGFWKYRAGKD